MKKSKAGVGSTTEEIHYCKGLRALAPGHSQHMGLPQHIGLQEPKQGMPFWVSRGNRSILTEPREGHPWGEEKRAPGRYNSVREPHGVGLGQGLRELPGSRAACRDHRVQARSGLTICVGSELRCSNMSGSEGGRQSEGSRDLGTLGPGVSFC